MFSCLHYPLSWSSGFCAGRGKRGSLGTHIKGPLQEKCWINQFESFFSLPNISIGTRKQEKEVKHEEN